MNRQARRAARPDTYELTAQAMLSALKDWLAAHKGVPRFAFPPDDIALAAPLGELGHRLARDQNARELVSLFCNIGREVGGATPTCLMLEAVLKLADVPIERVPLDDLGLRVRPMGNA